jgi:protein-disulfide isomerase
MRLGAVLLLSISGITGFAQTGAKSALDKATLESYLRRVEVFGGPVNFKIDDPKPSPDLPGFLAIPVHITSDEGGSKEELYYVSKDGQTIIQGDPAAITVFNINRSPFQPNLDRLHTENQPSFGPMNAPVTIVEFGDLECPSCRAEAPALRQLVPQAFPDKVRVVFKDFPLESIHPWARAASIAGRCVFRQNQQAFWKFYDWMYEVQDEIMPETLNPRAKEWAGKNGLNSMEFDRCVDTKATDAEVAANIAEGRALGVKGTPSLFINGHKIGGVDFTVLQKLIETELQYAGKTR